MIADQAVQVSSSSYHGSTCKVFSRKPDCPAEPAATIVRIVNEVRSMCYGLCLQCLRDHADDSGAAMLRFCARCGLPWDNERELMMFNHT